MRPRGPHDRPPHRDRTTPLVDSDRPARAPGVWSDLSLLARRELGPFPLVGYESGPDLIAPITVGFEPVGPLRVWLR